jgi:hypothetical protein
VRRLYAFLIAAVLCFPSIGAMAWWQSIQQVGVSAAPTYQGPGDVVSGATAWGSCARAYSAAQASTATSLCDLVAVTGGATVCTLRATASGFVDLAASYCAGTTPALACAAASGGSCKVTKAYDQTGNSNHFTQATLASMPGLVFSAINSLPGMQCGTPAQLTSPGLTMSQPYTLASAYIRTSGTATGASIGSGNGAYVGSGAIANVAQAAAGGGPLALSSVTDNAWHAISGVMNNTSSVINVDGAEATGAAGTATYAGNALRLCTDNTTFLVGRTMEGGIWPSAFNSTQRTNMNANIHGSNGYNF